jgi:site-specific recombinase XerD
MTQALAPRVLSGTVIPAAAVELADSWPLIVDRWLAAQTSARTREGYGREAGLFTDWCDGRGLDPRAARRHDIEAFRNDRTSAGDSARTLARRLSAVSSLYTYGGSYGLGANPVTGVKRPKVDRNSSPSQSLARGEVPELLAAAEADSPRSGALIALLVLAGLRVSEALSADVADLGYDKGHRTLTIRAKGGAETKIPLAVPVARAVDAAVGRRTAGPILATSSGKPMDRRHAHRTVQRLAAAAGVADAEHIGPHDLRHTSVTGVLEMTGSIDAGQRHARHASPVTTQGYDHRRRNLDDHPGYGLAGWFATKS